MVTIGIYAIQRSRRFEIRTDESLTVGALGESIRKILDDDRAGYLLNCERKGFMASGGSLYENGIRTGMELIYISKLIEDRDRI